MTATRIDRLCLMVPTYGRSKTSLPAFINSAIEKVSNVKNICFSFCVNVKDIETREYLANYDWPHGCEWEIIDENRMQPHLAIYFNLMYDNTRFNGYNVAVSMLGDDMTFETQDYDLFIMKDINNYNGYGVFWVDDDYIAHETLCVNLFVTRKMVEATRKPFMCVEDSMVTSANMIDVIWYLIGTITHTAHYNRDVIIKHRHSTAAPVDEWDNTFMRLRPLQVLADEKANMKKGRIYANNIARRLVAQGIGNY